MNMPELVLDHVVVGEGHVGGGERLAVLPLGLVGDREGPDLAVGRGLPRLGEADAGLVGHVGGAEADEQVVVDGPDLVAGRLVADERVQAVRVVGPAQVQDRLVGGGRRCLARGERSAQADPQADDEDGCECERDEQAPSAQPVRCGHGSPLCCRAVARGPTAASPRGSRPHVHSYYTPAESRRGDCGPAAGKNAIARRAVARRAAEGARAAPRGGAGQPRPSG